MYCLLMLTTYCMYFMILRSRKIRSILTRQKNMYLNSSACNSFVRGELMDDVSRDCEQCGRRRYSFWNDTLGDLLIYLSEPRSRANRIVAITHNVALDLNFILNRAIMLKWKAELMKMYENGAFSIFGHRFLPSVCTAKTARCFRSADH